MHHLPSRDDADIATLSRYYPAETVYFYGFPSGEDSNFFNADPAWRDELIAARPFVCAGNAVRVLTFSSLVQPELLQLMTDDLGVALLDHSRIVTLPTGITSQVYGKARNARIKSALRFLAPPRTLVMAQPYLDPLLNDRYQIPPAISIAMNDKIHRTRYIPARYLPKEYARFPNGAAFANNTGALPLPCVVKIASSSSGDGVRICHTLSDITKAQKEFHNRLGALFVEEYIVSRSNFGVLFGIPFDKQRPIDVLGYNEQITTEDGGYLGGVIRRAQDNPFFKTIAGVLLQIILPAVRRMGWYGVGGLDVLLRDDGRFFFIDPNFRMTAAFPYISLMQRQTIRRSVVSFTGFFKGSRDEFRKTFVPLARADDPEQRMMMIALTKKRDTYLFNAGMFFDDDATICTQAATLLACGIRSIVLQRLKKSFFTEKK